MLTPDSSMPAASTSTRQRVLDLGSVSTASLVVIIRCASLKAGRPNGWDADCTCLEGRRYAPRRNIKPIEVLSRGLLDQLRRAEDIATRLRMLPALSLGVTGDIDVTSGARKVGAALRWRTGTLSRGFVTKNAYGASLYSRPGSCA